MTCAWNYDEWKNSVKASKKSQQKKLSGRPNICYGITMHKIDKFREG